MQEKKQCANDQCGKWFEAARPNQIYCCQKCGKSFHNRAENKIRRKLRKTSLSGPNRPYTADTIYLIHKWHREGMDSKEIGDLLMRSVENVRQALREPLTYSQEKTMEEYLCTAKTPHRDTQGED